MPHLDAFLTLMREGFALPDLASLVLRLGVGVFFAVSGWINLTCPICHDQIKSKLERSGIPGCGGLMVWWVSGCKFVAGVALALGLFTAAAAFVLLVVCMVALIVTHEQRIAEKNPVHLLDAVSGYLCMFPLLLAWMLIAVMALGPGAWSLDYFWRFA